MRILKIYFIVCFFFAATTPLIQVGAIASAASSTNRIPASPLDSTLGENHSFTCIHQDTKVLVNGNFGRPSLSYQVNKDQIVISNDSKSISIQRSDEISNPATKKIIDALQSLEIPGDGKPLQLQANRRNEVVDSQRSKNASIQACLNHRICEEQSRQSPSEFKESLIATGSPRNGLIQNYSGVRTIIGTCRFLKENYANHSPMAAQEILQKWLPLTRTVLVKAVSSCLTDAELRDDPKLASIKAAMAEGINCKTGCDGGTNNQWPWNHLDFLRNIESPRSKIRERSRQSSLPYLSRIRGDSSQLQNILQSFSVLLNEIKATQDCCSNLDCRQLHFGSSPLESELVQPVGDTSP